MEIEQELEQERAEDRDVLVEETGQHDCDRFQLLPHVDVSIGDMINIWINHIAGEVVSNAVISCWSDVTLVEMTNL